jgi:class 3 adenylate cyclase
VAQSSPNDGPTERPERPSSSAATAAPSLTHGFLFADLRGYTRYVEEHGDHAGAQMLARYRTLVRREVAAFRGAEIKTEGDSFYVVFDSASAAVRCGLAIVGAAAVTGEDPDDAIRVGVGVHAGETVETAEGYVGSVVNIAARLCAQAKAGELVVSDTVRALTRTYLDVEFEPLGTRRLKGLDEPIAIDRVVPRASAGPRVTRSRRAGTRRWWLAGLGVAALVVLAVVGAVAWQGGRSSPAPSPTPAAASTSASGAPSAEPSASGDGRGLTDDERALLARVPLDFQPYCRRSSLPDGALGGSASLRCDLPVGSPGYGADVVWYDAFDQRGLMPLAMNGLVERQQLPIGECGPDTSGVVGRWELGTTFTGQLACYAKDGGAWVAWTYEGDQIAARAVRRDGDAEGLYAWWEDLASGFLR